MKIQLKLPWVKLPKDLVRGINFAVLFLIDHHAIEEGHLCAPSRYSLEPLMSVAYLVKEFEALIPFGPRLSTRVILRV
jgi:hypothetical protein